MSYVKYIKVCTATRWTIRHSLMLLWFTDSKEKRKTTLWCSFNRVLNWRLVCPMYSLSQSLRGLEKMASVRCSFVTGSLGLAKICPKVWKGFWVTLTLWLFKILLMGSVTPYRNVRNNSKTSCWFLLIIATSNNYKLQLVTLLMRRNQQLVLLLFLTFRGCYGTHRENFE